MFYANDVWKTSIGTASLKPSLESNMSEFTLCSRSKNEYLVFKAFESNTNDSLHTYH